jgi:hypothetical protein
MNARPIKLADHQRLILSGITTIIKILNTGYYPAAIGRSGNVVGKAIMGSIEPQADFPNRSLDTSIKTPTVEHLRAISHFSLSSV